jgi:hypothetical protein
MISKGELSALDKIAVSGFAMLGHIFEKRWFWMRVYNPFISSFWDF